MDDPQSEREIQESSGGNSENGKLGWMMRLGKKMLVTGIVVSSAPIVLPPLVAISAIGFVCSVPYGIMLVSYACAETFMSRLLPIPSPIAPLMLEYCEEEANGYEKQGEQYQVIKGRFDMEREEDELKEDLIEEVEMRIGEGNILQEDANSKGGVENDDKKSMEEVDEFVEGNRYEEDDGEFLDEQGERPSQIFDVEVNEITELKVEQPNIEESKDEQPAGESCGSVAVNGEDKKQSNKTEIEIPLEAVSVQDNEELVREIRGLLGINEVDNKSDYARDEKESVENVDAQRKATMNTEFEVDETTKGKGEQSITGNVYGQKGDKTHEGEEKGTGNVNKGPTADVKNVAIQIVQGTDIESGKLERESRRSLERDREKGRNRDAVEEKQGVKRAKVDAEGKLLKGNEGTTERKQEQPHIEESVIEQPVKEDSGSQGGLERSEKNDSNIEETPLEVKNTPVQLVQAIDVIENEKLVMGARGLSEKTSDERIIDHEVDDKQRADIVNAGGAGKQSNEIEVNIEGTTEAKAKQYLGDESTSEERIEEVCNIVAEFEGVEKTGSNIEMETPFHMKNVTVQLSESTDIEGDEELASETTGLLEKIRDEGRTDYAADDKQSTEKDDKNIVEDVEKTENRCVLAHDSMGKPTRVFDTKENKEDDIVQMKESEKTKVDNIPSAVLVSETVKDDSGTTELIVESATLMEGGQAEEDNVKNVEQNYLLNSEKKDVVFSNEKERQIDGEQGLDLLSTVSRQGSSSYVNTFEESQPSASYTDHLEITDSSELPVSSKGQESDDIQVSAESASDTASNEALYSEAKVWEQISALRTIVGYEAARKETSIDELKALYLFTGIEPPASFKDTSDVAEVNAKLRFLMSVVGVK